MAAFSSVRKGSGLVAAPAQNAPVWAISSFRLNHEQASRQQRDAHKKVEKVRITLELEGFRGSAVQRPWVCSKEGKKMRYGGREHYRTVEC